MPFPLIPILMAVASKAMSGSNAEAPGPPAQPAGQNDFVGSYLQLQEERRREQEERWRRQQEQFANMLSTLGQPTAFSGESPAFTSILSGLSSNQRQ